MDGRNIFHFCLEKLCPNTEVDAFEELATIKQIKLSDFNYDVPDFLAELEEKRVDVNDKIANVYSDKAAIRDIFYGCSKSPCRQFNDEVSRMNHQYLRGNPDG